MDKMLCDVKEREAQGMMVEFGYAPNPHCEHCNGLGHVHPMKYDGRADYSKVVMCNKPGCMAESYHKYLMGK